MKRANKSPQRMCIACREMKEKQQLMRIVRTPEGKLLLDDSGKKSGRGAYLCRDAACWKRAQKARSIERALHVKPDPDLLEQISQLLADTTQQAKDEQTDEQ